MGQQTKPAKSDFCRPKYAASQLQLQLSGLLVVSGVEAFLDPGVINAQELVLGGGHVDEVGLALEYENPFKGNAGQSVHDGLNEVKAIVLEALAVLCPFRAFSSRPFQGWS